MAPELNPERCAVFLDRDGVINEKPQAGSYVRDWSEFRFLKGVASALAALQAAGAILFIVTNQRGVARGAVDVAALDDIHARMRSRLQLYGAHITGVYVCPHEAGECDCRKPETGLFLQAKRDHPRLSFQASHLVGDSLTDLQAGHQLGLRLWLVGTRDDRALVGNEASRLGISIAGSAASLAQLVGQLGILVSIGRSEALEVDGGTSTRPAQ